MAGRGAAINCAGIYLRLSDPCDQRLAVQCSNPAGRATEMLCTGEKKEFQEWTDRDVRLRLPVSRIDPHSILRRWHLTVRSTPSQAPMVKDGETRALEQGTIRREI